MGEAHTNDVHYDPMAHHLRTNHPYLQNEEKEVLDLRKLTSLKGPECGSEEQSAIQMVFPNRYVSVYTVGLACTRI